MIITLLEVSQALPARPSGGSSMKTKVCEEEEEEEEAEEEEKKKKEEEKQKNEKKEKELRIVTVVA